MDNKINDIFTNLDEEIDISNTHKLNKTEILYSYKHGTKDLTTNLDRLDFSCDKNYKILKNKTVNFDSFIRIKKLKKIDISNKPTFKEKIFLGLKGKITLGGDMIGVFNKRVFFTKRFFKNIGIISFILLLILGSLSYIIEYKTKSGYNKILSLKENSGDINYIQNTLNSAKLDFILADILFTPFTIIPNENIKNGYYLLEGGKNLTKFLDNGLQSYLSLNTFIKNKGGIEKVKLTNLFINTKSDISTLNSLLYNVLLSYNNIGDLGNEKLNSDFLFAKNSIKKVYNVLNIINNDFDIILGLLGHNDEKKYLILFQNNDEIRATGGFIGSLATVTIKNGEVINFIKDDVYAYEWEINKIYKTKSIAPEGLNKITDTFGLRDSNYFIDFESSSKSINFFLKKIGKDVDGIIYINQNTILDFLKLTGPINFEQISNEITEDNFSLIISTLVEAQSFKVGTLGTPKKVLFDFANIFIGKLKEDKDYFAYIDLIIKNIKSRDLVIYSFNSEENNLLWKLGLNGKINFNDTLDYAYPVYTSIGGNKSDRYIELKYEKNIKYNFDCSIDTNIKIYRTHFFSKFEEAKVNDLLDKYPIKDKSRKDILNIQGKGENKSYVRVVLPKDIIVKPIDGMIVDKYENSTVVSFYSNTRVLESTNINIEYLIENKDCKDYDFKLYKQPGIRDYSVKIIDLNNKNFYNSITTDFIYKK